MKKDHVKISRGRKLNSDKKKLVLELHQIGAIRFGEFILKSGMTSPFYIDLRRVVSYPSIMKMITRLFTEAVLHLSYDLITGIPYTALPMASLLSAKVCKPLIYPRKEAKSYGTAQQIEGIYREGQKCLVIDDVMTTGESKIEIAETLKAAGLHVENFIVLIDRSYKGRQYLEENGYKMDSILSISDILEVLDEEKLITKDQLNAVSRFLLYDVSGSKMTYSQRMAGCTNPSTKTLMQRIEEKQSNLILSLDVDNQETFFSVLDAVAEHVVMVKTHVDILRDFTPQFIQTLKKKANEYDVLIFEDRKFADIGSTVKKQFRGGVYTIAEWADYITVHLLPGPGILKGLYDDNPPRCSAFLLAAMSAEGNLITDNYTRRVIDIATQFKENVSGFIGFGKTEKELRKLKNKIPDDMLLLTPGVHMEQKGDGLGQQYVSVEEAIRGGSDAIIVGRGIYGAENPAKKAAEYRKKAWEAFRTYNF